MWVLPTIGRPASCQAFLDSVAALGFGHKPTPGLVIVDGDPDEAYRALRLPLGWTIEFREENAGFLACLNRAFAEHPGEPWYGLLNDDFIVRTGGWDHKLVAAAGNFGFANSNDGWQADGAHSKKRMCGAIVFGGDMLRALGWWSPPGMAHCYADDAWEAIGSTIGNWKTCLDVMVEHRHAWTGKSEPDATHEKAYSYFDADAEVWKAFQQGELGAAINRLGNAINDADPRGRDRLARAKSRSVMIVTPIARDPTWQYMISLLETAKKLDDLGIRYLIQFTMGSSNLPRARNALAARFLATGMTDLIMIDDDMGWSAGSVVRLLASEQPLVAAVGRKKTPEPNSDPKVWCCHFLPGDLEQDEMGAVQVARVGTAFMKVERGVFETMIAFHPEWKREGHPDMTEAQKASYYQFFRFDTENDGAESGEDYVFCDRWRAIGGSVWIDPTIDLKHCGAKEYSGRVAEIMHVVDAAQPSALLEAAE